MRRRSILAPLAAVLSLTTPALGFELETRASNDTIKDVCSQIQSAVSAASDVFSPGRKSLRDESLSMVVWASLFTQCFPC